MLPVNLFTVAIVGFLGIPGILGLICLADLDVLDIIIMLHATEEAGEPSFFFCGPTYPA